MNIFGEVKEKKELLVMIYSPSQKGRKEYMASFLFSLYRSKILPKKTRGDYFSFFILFCNFGV